VGRKLVAAFKHTNGNEFGAWELVINVKKLQLVSEKLSKECTLLRDIVELATENLQLMNIAREGQ